MDAAFSEEGGQARGPGIDVPTGAVQEQHGRAFGDSRSSGKLLGKDSDRVTSAAEAQGL